MIHFNEVLFDGKLSTIENSKQVFKHICPCEILKIVSPIKYLDNIQKSC
jgi:hypothetical protein